MSKVSKRFVKTFDEFRKGELVMIESLDYAAVMQVYKVVKSVIPSTEDGDVMVYLEGCPMPIKFSLLASAESYIEYRAEGKGITPELAEKLREQVAHLKK